MANAATLEGTRDISGVWARVQTLLPWQRKAPPAKKPETDSDDDGDEDSGRRLWKIPVATLICIVILIAGVGIRIFDPPFVESLRVKTFDLYQRISPRPIGEYPVGIIDIDEKSLAVLGQWPWPRTTIAKLLEKAHEMGAAVVGFDVVFAEHDRMSPALVASSLAQLDETTRQHLRTLPSNESFMADVLKRSRVVLGQVGLPGDMPAGKKSANTPTAVVSVIDKRAPESRIGGMKTFDWQKHWLLKYKN